MKKIQWTKEQIYRCSFKDFVRVLCDSNCEDVMLNFCMNTFQIGDEMMTPGQFCSLMLDRNKIGNNIEVRQDRDGQEGDILMTVYFIENCGFISRAKLGKPLSEIFNETEE